MALKILHVIAGATASGKTSLAINIAKHLQTEILSADSRQCYTEMNIGVAKPTAEELLTIPHHFINSHSIHQPITAGEYERYGLLALEQIFNQSNHAVLVGGTGLYIKALCEGFDIMPNIDSTIDQEINDLYTKNGLLWLQQEIEKTDIQFTLNGEMDNPHRIIRALVFKLSTGKSITDYKKNNPKARPFAVNYHVIALPREQLYENINSRVLHMMDAGLLQEAKQLHAYASLKTLQTIGYQELFSHINNEITLKDAVALIQKNTRNYAKRQLTWFKKQYLEAFDTSENIVNKIYQSRY
jgi:tRNA dimethylallyltransferase